jgi:hypothetical protein
MLTCILMVYCFLHHFATFFFLVIIFWCSQKYYVATIKSFCFVFKCGFLNIRQTEIMNKNLGKIQLVLCICFFVRRTLASDGQSKTDWISSDICEMCSCVKSNIDCTRHVYQNGKILSNEDFQPFGNSTRRVTFDLQESKSVLIDQMAFVSLSGLISLHLKHVGFAQSKAPDLANQEYIEEIVIQNSNLETVDKTICQAKRFLVKIDLSFNRISELMGVFDECIRLTLLDLSFNSIKHIDRIFTKPNRLQSLNLGFNSIEHLADVDLMHMPNLIELSLANNNLKRLDPNPFQAQNNLKKLNLANNNLRSLPDSQQVYASLTHFYIDGNSELLDIPDSYTFASIRVLKFHYAYHCCAFQGKQVHMPTLHGLHVTCDNTNVLMGNPCRKTVECQPQPDLLLNPCQNLLGNWWFRIAVWLISFISITCNIFVVSFNLVQALFITYNQINVPRFLLVNLATADSLMAIYLLSIAIKDYTSRNEFEKSALAWQRSLNCEFAGFLSILSFLSSALSLAFITFERFYAIKNSLNLNKRVSMRVALYGIGLIWIVALAIASMPLMQINRYSMYAVCLPLDTSTQPSRIYVAVLIFFLVSCFAFISLCYTLLLYDTLQLERRSSNLLCSSDNLMKMRAAEDHKLIKNVSLLVVANIICWGPLVLACLYGMFTYSDLNRTWIKILAVFIIPFNSLINPVLYCLSGRRFRLDFFKLLGYANMSASSSHT